MIKKRITGERLPKKDMNGIYGSEGEDCASHCGSGCDCWKVDSFAPWDAHISQYDASSLIYADQ